MSGLDPSYIMQVGMGFFASKTLLSAVELELFTKLAHQPMTGGEIAAALQLSPRAVPDFPDTLVALKFLHRDGDGPEARYSNRPECALFLDRNSLATLAAFSKWRMPASINSGRTSPMDRHAAK
jgi:hypothetical protein